MELVLGANTYDIGKLNVTQQFHVARRLAPAIWALSRSAASVLKEAMPEGVALTMDNVVKGLKGLEDGALVGAVISAAGPLVDVMAHMSDADTEYVINTCLSVCSRQAGQGWQILYVPGSGFTFQDMSLPEMLQLVIAAIRANLANFTPAPAIPQ